MTAPRQFKPKGKGKDKGKVESMEECKDQSKNGSAGEGTGNTTTAILRRKVSWWSEKNATASGWDGKSIPLKNAT